MASVPSRVDPLNGAPNSFNQTLDVCSWQEWASQPVDKNPLSMMPYEFRFKEGDRVLCNLGPRWLLGTVLEVNFQDPEGPAGHRFPYVVKTDAVCGTPSKTIMAPGDNERIIIRDRCFNAEWESEISKWAAPITSQETRRSLRFDVSDSVCIRVRDTAEGYEQWICGHVAEVWPALPGPAGEGLLMSAESIPYLIETDDDEIFYCHRDDHTLIRSPENVPRTPCKGISQRFERRTRPDGTIEMFDHVTLQSRVQRDERDHGETNMICEVASSDDGMSAPRDARPIAAAKGASEPGDGMAKGYPPDRTGELGGPDGNQTEASSLDDQGLLAAGDREFYA